MDTGSRSQSMNGNDHVDDDDDDAVSVSIRFKNHSKSAKKKNTKTNIIEYAISINKIHQKMISFSLLYASFFAICVPPFVRFFHVFVVFCRFNAFQLTETSFKV